MEGSEKKVFADQDDLRIQKVQQVALAGVIVNILLSIVKFTFGIWGKSQAVIADAVHSLSDLSTDFAVIFGVKVWSKPADEDHPYGHRRIEAFVTISIGIVLLMVAGGMAYHALLNMQKGDGHQPGMIALVGSVLSVFFKEILYRWTLAAGKEAKSSALIANAWHHRTDALSSVPVVLAVLAAAVSPKWAFLDYIGAFVVSLFIAHAAWRIMRSAFLEMIDTGTSQKGREKIYNIVMETEGVKSSHAIRSRRMGSGWYVDLHIQVDPQMSVRLGHDISEKVKRNLMDKGPDVFDVVVHLEPHEK
ncbi:MAG: cation transporter [Candidatus Omnitrophica bacterium]|nr:cation transporter [Candidatus Omnitrophota bacterium]